MKNRVFSLIVSILLILVAVAPLGTVSAVPTVILPSLTADSNCVSYNSYGDSRVYYYKGVKKTDYDSYTSNLQGQGYAVIQSYDADGCYHSLLDNGRSTIYVSFLRSVSGNDKGRLRVFVQASGTPYHTQKEATTGNVCDPMLWQLNIDNSGGQDSCGGMSYVIRLTDGTFVVVDGGYDTEAEADNLYSVLAANNKLSGAPVVSAWFITHLHIDHYGALRAFTNKYLNDVTVEGFYYNFPSEKIGDISGTNAQSVETTMKSWKDATLYSKIHSGMVMGFAGATVEIISTHEDVRQSYYDNSASYSLTKNALKNGNDTSTVFRFNIAGQKILFLGDAYSGTGNAILNTYTASYIKSDIMQMAHHGFTDGISKYLIGIIDPDVVLWPMDIIYYKNGEITADIYGDTKTFGYHYNLSNSYVRAVKSCASEIIPSYKNEELSLPYTANTLYKGQTADYENLIEAKKKILEATANQSMYVQQSNDQTRIRFIGVLDITEAELETFESFGFDIAMRYNGKTYKISQAVSTVYKSVNAAGQKVTAEELGGTYLYVIEIPEIDPATSKLEFIISGTGNYGGYELSYSTGRYIPVE